MCFLRGWPPLVLWLGEGCVLKRVWEGVLSWLLWWGGERERGAGASQNPYHLPWVTRYLLPMLSLHDQGRGPWILLHVVSGPWTSLVAVHDKGQSKIAVCRRHTPPIGPPSCCSIEAWGVPSRPQSLALSRLQVPLPWLPSLVSWNCRALVAVPATLLGLFAVAASPGSLLLLERPLDLHRAPLLRKLLGGSFAASLLLTLRCRHSRRISRWHVRMRRACCPTFRCRFAGCTGSSVPPLLSCFISAFP